jgi:predicted esterase
MELESHVVEARAHGRFLVRAPEVEANGVVVGFHGYMQDAGILLDDLASIPGAETWALVSVDALNAFYARGSGSGRVVRGWMTRDLREEAIEDNVRYVRGVLDLVRARFGWSLPVVALGYSQGASMAWRAALLAGHEVAAVAALCGDLPPELDELPAASPFPRRALLARGENDDWYTADKLAADRARLAGRGVAVTELVFAGGHEWTDPFRAAAGALLAESAAGLSGQSGGSRRGAGPL